MKLGLWYAVGMKLFRRYAVARSLKCGYFRVPRCTCLMELEFAGCNLEDNQAFALTCVFAPGVLVLVKATVS